MKNHKIVLFDGICNFCNFWVNFIIDRDKKNVFKFTALQSEKGQGLLERCRRDENFLSSFHSSGTSFDTFVLIDGDKVYTKSSAAFNICKDLKGIWRFLYFLILIPEPFRDFLYTVVAKNRYKFFGKRNACRIPTDEEREKFLE